MTIFSRLYDHVERRPKEKAVNYFSKGHLYSMTWQEVYDQILNYAKALIDLGVKKGDCVAIFSNTCKEWGFLDLAIMSLGAKTVPVYHSSHKDDVNFVLEHCGAEIVFVENQLLLQKLMGTDQYNNLKKIVIMKEFDQTDERHLSLDNFVNLDADFDLKKLTKELKSSDEATVIYTSGTSGTPKGALLTHKQILSAVSETFPLLGVTRNDRSLSFLPFSHVLGRIELWGHYFVGFTISYAESIERLKRNLPEVKPTVFVGVPRIFEKIYYGILAQIEISKVKSTMFKQAVEVGKKIADYRRKRKSPPMHLALKYQIAKRTVYAPIQEKLGGQLRFAVSGGAPLDPEIAAFFEACGLNILEGYGLTETTGPIFVNTLFDYRVGTVGRPIGDTEVRVEEDGEILVKSDKIMTGYYKNPEATKQVFTEDGFFKTGDIGEIDKDGFLKITDRKKDLIKTAGGKFVAPQKLQNLFATSPLVGHVHIHGDKKKYIVALITLEKDGLNIIRSKYELNDRSFDRLISHPIIEKEIRKTVAEVNEKLATFETIKRYQILDHEFTVEGGQLTPSLKIKRKNIDEQYRDQIDSLYN